MSTCKLDVSDWDPKQYEIQLFWPLTEQTNLDLDYTPCEEYRNTLRKDTTPEYKRYCNRVHKLSKKIYEQFMDEINPNNYPRGLAGETGVYHLDHIVSIRYGFDNNLLPEDVACKENLQMLPWKENISKGK